jgi:hypothetical protein
MLSHPQIKALLQKENLFPEYSHITKPTMACGCTYPGVNREEPQVAVGCYPWRALDSISMTRWGRGQVPQQFGMILAHRPVGRPGDLAGNIGSQGRILSPMSSEVLWTLQNSDWLFWQGHSYPGKAEGVGRSTGLSKAQICPSSPVAGGMACQVAEPVPLPPVAHREGGGLPAARAPSTKWIRVCKWAKAYSGSWVVEGTAGCHCHKGWDKEVAGSRGAQV